MDFLQLPELVLERLICRYLVKEKLKIACCSKKYYKLLKYLLWREIFIPWRYIAAPEVLPCSIKRNFQHVSILHFGDVADSFNIQYPNTGKLVVKNYQIILYSCNLSRVHKLTVYNILEDEGMRMLSERLTNLEDLLLIDCFNITPNGWEQLAGLSNLKKLTLKNCFIRNTGIEKLSSGENLEELTLNIDWKDNIYITRNAMKHISNLVKLKKLTISCSYELLFSIRDLQSLKILDKLIDLSLEHTLLDDNALCYLVKVACNLEHLNIKGCYKLTDTCLSELTSLRALKKVNLQDINLSDNALEVFCKATGMKEMMKPQKRILTKYEYCWPKN